MLTEVKCSVQCNQQVHSNNIYDTGLNNIAVSEKNLRTVK